VDVDLSELSEYVARAHGHRPELGMLDAAVAARRAELAIHRARFFPDLAIGLRASYSWGPGITNIANPFITDRANTQSLGAALVMRWNLDFVGSYHRSRRAEAQLAQVQAQDQQAHDAIRLEVIATYEQLRDADRREVAWARGERQTRSWFVAAGQAYQVGTSEPRELVDAMKAYFTNRFNHLEALREFNTAAASLERVTGAPLVAPDAWEQSCSE
jgi:outer membrane protein TolC